MSVLAIAIAIATCSYDYVDLELEDQIFRVKQITPLYTVLNANSRGDKIFQRGPNISEIFVPGVQKFQQRNK